MNIQNFEIIKASVLQDIEKPQNNLDEMGDLIQKLAFKYDGDFDWLDKRIEGFKNLTYEEFLNFSRAYLGKANKRRLGILLKGNIPEENAFNYTRVNDIRQLKKISTFSPSYVK